jgi:DNA-binding NtrC family response regulator
VELLEPAPTERLPPEAHTERMPLDARAGELIEELEAVERERVLDALARCAGNQTKAARLLGMSRGTFIARLDAYGITRPRKPSTP